MEIAMYYITSNIYISCVSKNYQLVRGKLTYCTAAHYKVNVEIVKYSKVKYCNVKYSQVKYCNVK